MSRDKADTLLLLVSCALVLLPHLHHLPLWIAPLCVGLLVWRGWITFRGERMPPVPLLLSVALLAMSCVYFSYHTFLGRDAGVAMLCLLLTLKLLEMHAKRDLFVVLFLGFFLVLSGFFYSQSIASAAIMVVAVIAILTTQLSFQYTGLVPSLWQRLRLGAAILGLAVPLTLVLFLLFPRINGPLWGLPEDAHAGLTGLSDTMSPGNISRLANSDDVAFRVKFADRVPRQSSLYWRGIVLGRYDGRTWSALPAQRDRRAITLRLRGESIPYQVTLEPHGRRWLFALDIPQAAPSLPASLSPDFEMTAAQPVTERIRYDVVSRVDFDLQPNESLAVLHKFLDLPREFNPRTIQHAVELRARFHDPGELINAVLEEFRELNFRYTLEPPILGQHAVDEFLFDTRAGFCEHYSSAFVFLMRATGIPARVVTGYQGGEMNPRDGYMTIRQSDAHAWAEVWLKNRGWVRVDPTAAVAPERVEHNLARAMPRRELFGGLITFDRADGSWLSSWIHLRQQWDAINNAWNQGVLNYTSEKQKNFLQSLGIDSSDWRIVGALLIGFGGIALALAVVPLLLQQQKRDALDVIYVAFCRIMARRGLPRAQHEGPRTYAVRLIDDVRLAPETRKALSRFLALYEALKYGVAADQTRATRLAQLRSLLAQCR